MANATITMEEFIDRNRTTLLVEVRERVGDPDLKLSDDELEDWVMNNEVLYNWAIGQGVDV
jgi:hypothetical protein